MALELLSKKVSCKYKHNSLRETLSCLLNPFPPSTSPHQTHTPNTRIPCHPHQMRTWVFFLRVQNGRDPYTRGHFSSVHRKGEKRLFFFFFCTQKESAFPKICNVETCFLYQRLNFRGCSPNAPPHFTSAPFCQKKKKKETKTACHNPPCGMHSNLPAKGRKEKKDGENNNNDDNAPRPLRF